MSLYKQKWYILMHYDREISLPYHQIGSCLMYKYEDHCQLQDYVDEFWQDYLPR